MNHSALITVLVLACSMSACAKEDAGRPSNLPTSKVDATGAAVTASAGSASTKPAPGENFYRNTEHVTIRKLVVGDKIMDTFDASPEGAEGSQAGVITFISCISKLDANDLEMIEGVNLYAGMSPMILTQGSQVILKRAVSYKHTYNGGKDYRQTVVITCE